MALSLQTAWKAYSKSGIITTPCLPLGIASDICSIIGSSRSLRVFLFFGMHVYFFLQRNYFLSMYTLTVSCNIILSKILPNVFVRVYWLVYIGWEHDSFFRLTLFSFFQGFPWKWYQIFWSFTNFPFTTSEMKQN